MIIKKARMTKKKTARELLFSHYRVLFPATLFFIALSFGFVLLSNTYLELLTVSASDDVFFTALLTLDIATFLLIYPFFMGYISLFAKAASGMNAELSDMLCFFRARRLFKCYGFLLSKIPGIILGVALPMLLLQFAEIYTAAGTVYGYLNPYLAIAYLLMCLWFVYLGVKFMLSAMDFSVGERHKYRIREKAAMLKAQLGLIPAYILAVLSFGILFFTYALPITVMLYAVYAKSRKEDDEETPDTRVFDIIASTAPTGSDNEITEE